MVIDMDSSRNILVVEDSKMISSFLKISIEEQLHAAVTVAMSLSETKEVLSQDPVDYFIAILDLTLPDAQDGEVVDLVLEHKIPSIVLTSSIDNELRASIVDKGVIDYVLKSRDSVNQLVEIIKRLTLNHEVKILVVDDSVLMRQIFQGYLGVYGFQLLQAKHGVEALALLEEHDDIRLVITDYEMPEMDGFELCAKIREHKTKNELAIIGVSSFDDDLLSAKLIKGGANDFLPKPFQREELYCRVIQNIETLDYINKINESLSTIQKLNQRMTRDLEAAANLQRSLLPDAPPKVAGALVDWLFKPCDELAGDTYNVFPLDEHHLGIYVLDVSGHGVPSALLSVTLSRLLVPDTDRSNLLCDYVEGEGHVHIVPPGEVCNRLNTQFPMDPETFQYFTIVYGVLNTKTGDFSFSTAGHPGPIHVSKDKPVQAYKTLSPAIGFVPNMEFPEEHITLESGDKLFFYTDGIVEAQNEEKEEFSLERLSDFLNKHIDESLQDAMQKTYETIVNWNNNEFKDDVTICAVEYCGNKPAVVLNLE